MAGAGFGAADDDGTWGFKATPDGKVILGNTSDDVIQVTGSLDINGNIYAAEYIYHVGDTDTFLRFQDSDLVAQAGGVNFFKFTQADAAQSKMTFNNSGEDVDFIVKSPDESLAVYLNADNEVLHINHGESAFKTKIHSTHGEAITVNNNGVIINEDGHATNDFRIESDLSSSIFFVDSGNNKIGIGTDDPDYTLDVAGNIGVDEFIYHNGDDDTFIKFIDDTIILKAAGSSMLRADPDLGQVIVNNGTIDLDFVVRSDDGSDLLYTDAANNRVGIGTDSPDYTLDVAGNIGVDERIYHNGDADTYMIFTDDRVQFEVGNLKMLGMHKKASAPHQVTVNSNNNNVDFVVNSNNSSTSPILRADASTARVGIGTASPSVDLDVNGDVNVSGQFARGVASVNLGSSTTSTLDPGTEGAGTLLVTASSIKANEATPPGIHTCTLADGTVAGQILTIVMVSTFLAGAGGAEETGILIIGPESPLNSSYGIVTFTGEALGGTPIGSTAVLIWTGSAWAILSTRRGGGNA